ncbi:MAG TPA: primosomal protein N' [Rectinema sp.]|nr:primosomal protein N' [Rectinema sp.]
MPLSFLRIAYPIPLEETFWYRNDTSTRAKIGMRVEAPLGRRAKVIGYVVEAIDIPASESDLILGAEPQDALPTEMVGLSPAKLAKPEPPAYLEKPVLPTDLVKLEPSKIRSIHRVIDTEPLFDGEMLELGQWVASMYHCSLGEALSAMLPSARRERLEIAEQFDEIEVSRTPLVLTEGQKVALDGILAEPRGMFYLYGPTGTGKTEVFLQLADATLSMGLGVLYLVPEIALTRQVEQDARARFGEQCAIIHSRLTPSRKLAEWRRIAKKEARIVIGVRSAIFAPISNLGLIIIDEEHDGSYKSGTTPRYHARQVAMRRANLAGARLVMGSATPSPEAWQACEEGQMRRFNLSNRPAGGSFPEIHVIDMRGRHGLISEELAEALHAAKQAGRQSILFLNRRGFAHTLMCQTCGEQLLCKHCSVPLTYHKASNRLICHYCGYHEIKPRACPSCGSLDLAWASYGTERIEEELNEGFPEMSHARLDTDTTNTKGYLENTLLAFRNGNIDILVGTQMVAKGLNFPGVRVVGILMADQGLAMPDFRAGERVFSLIVQVAGRAGRHVPDGIVFIQTKKPDSPIIQLAAEGDVPCFLERELQIRRQLEFPPARRLCRFVFRSKSAKGARNEASKYADLARRIVCISPFEDIDILGPAECPLAVVADNHRYQLIFKAARFSDLQRFVKTLRHSIEPTSSVYIEIDIDPVQMM